MTVRPGDAVVRAGSTPTGELGRVQLRVAQSIKMLSQKKMQSLIWKPGISVSTASLGNSGVIDTHNKFDQLEATDSGWEYQPY